VGRLPVTDERSGQHSFDHVLVMNEVHLQRVLDEYRDFFNEARPHRGIGQRRPATADYPALVATPIMNGPIIAHSVLRALHHDYRLAA
jgi:hypothetical protein